MTNKLNSLKYLRYIGPIRRAEFYGRVIRVTRAESVEYLSTGMWTEATDRQWRNYKAKQGEKENVRASSV